MHPVSPSPDSPGGIRRILLLAADPAEVARLATDVEIREVREALERGRFGARFELIPAPATRLRDLQPLLDRIRPAIVHFAGHGSESSEQLLFHDDLELPAPARVDLIARVLEACEGVVLNACCSARQAEAIADRGPWAIGTAATIEDSEAKTFARCFYEKLANGCDVEDAFQGAAIQVGLEGRPESEAIPQFYPSTQRQGSASAYPLTNAVVQLLAKCARERVVVRTFHRLLMVRDVAPDYFGSVFDVVRDGISGKVAQWLRQQVQRHALVPTAEAGRLVREDPVLQAAREMARTESLTEADVRCYLVTVLRDRRSTTIAEIQAQFDKVAPDGFARLLEAARSHQPEPYGLRSAVTRLDLGT